MSDQHRELTIITHDPATGKEDGRRDYEIVSKHAADPVRTLDDVETILQAPNGRWRNIERLKGTDQ